MSVADETDVDMQGIERRYGDEETGVLLLQESTCRSNQVSLWPSSGLQGVARAPCYRSLAASIGRPGGATFFPARMSFPRSKRNGTGSNETLGFASNRSIHWEIAVPWKMCALPLEYQAAKTKWKPGRGVAAGSARPATSPITASGGERQRVAIRQSTGRRNRNCFSVMSPRGTSTVKTVDRSSIYFQDCEKTFRRPRFW